MVFKHCAISKKQALCRDIGTVILTTYVCTELYEFSVAFSYATFSDKASKLISNFHFRDTFTPRNLLVPDSQRGCFSAALWPHSP